MQFNFSNVNEAFKHIVTGIHDGSIPVEERDSRAGKVLSITEPVLICYNQPWERVLFNSARDANPFFHLFESLWMLAGRNDTTLLKKFSSTIEQIASDDGKTFNGAYGYRWRQAGQSLANPLPDTRNPYGEGIDQIDYLIDHLKRNPESRRAVLQMWTVEDDLLKIDSSKDVCCLSWDTKFRSPEGDTNIQTLAKKFQTEKGFKFPVYSIDTQTGDQRLCWMTNAWKVGTKPVYKVGFDDGSFTRMTGDHIVFRKKKLFEGKRCVGISITECQVCDLTVGDSLLAALPKDASCRTTNLSDKSKTQYRYFKRNIFKNTNRSNLVREHREYISLFESLKKGYSIHHKNGNGLDNRLENIEQLPNNIHYSMDKFGENNPHNKMTKEQKIERGKKHSVSIKSHWDSMDKETRQAYACKKVNRTERQWELIAEHQSAKSNHKIVSIEKEGETTVYDFTVPGRHNAVLDNGVVVHNCNTAVYFSLRPLDNYIKGVNALDMTVTNRSNDLIWGCLGANVVHFSFLQEYVAMKLGVVIGKYYQFTNNLHVYKDVWNPDLWLGEYKNRTMFSSPLDYTDKVDMHVPIYDEHFDQELRLFLSTINGYVFDRDWKSGFLSKVAYPMFKAFNAHKARNYVLAKDWCSKIKSDDWRIVCQQWISKRQKGYEKRNGTEAK